MIYQKIQKANNAIIGHGDVQKAMNVLMKQLRMTWTGMRNDVSRSNEEIKVADTHDAFLARRNRTDLYRRSR